MILAAFHFISFIPTSIFCEISNSSKNRKKNEFSFQPSTSSCFSIPGSHICILEKISLFLSWWGDLKRIFYMFKVFNSASFFNPNLLIILSLSSDCPSFLQVLSQKKYLITNEVSSVYYPDPSSPPPDQEISDTSIKHFL